MAPKSTTYLNSANLSRCPREILNALHRYRESFELNPTLSLKSAWPRLWESQRSLAHFLSANPNDLFLRPNVTSAFNTFILSAKIEKGSEILVGEHEYGSIVNICRLKAQRDSLSLRILKMPSNPVAFQNVTPTSLSALIGEQLSAKTALLLLSHVVGGTGLILPIQSISEETHRRNILFAIDGSYALGSLPVSLKDTGHVDFYGSSLYKYMMGPKGTAFGWVNPNRQDSLSIHEAGWTTFDPHQSPVDFGDSTQFAQTMMLKGCQDFSPYFAIADLAEWWGRQSPAKIRQKINHLNSYLVDQMQERLGWSVLQSRSAELNGPFSAFLIPRNLTIPADTLVNDLWEKNAIQTHAMQIDGSDYLVVSPHWENEIDDLDILVASLRTRVR